MRVKIIHKYPNRSVAVKLDLSGFFPHGYHLLVSHAYSLKHRVGNQDNTDAFVPF